MAPFELPSAIVLLRSVGDQLVGDAVVWLSGDHDTNGRDRATTPTEASFDPRQSPHGRTTSVAGREGP